MLGVLSSLNFLKICWQRARESLSHLTPPPKSKEFVRHHNFGRKNVVDCPPGSRITGHRDSPENFNLKD